MGAQPCPNGCPTLGDHHCPVNGAVVAWASYPFWAALRDRPSPPATTS